MYPLQSFVQKNALGVMLGGCLIAACGAALMVLLKQKGVSQPLGLGLSLTGVAVYLIGRITFSKNKHRDQPEPADTINKQVP
jgi:hypothetical protein